MMKKLMFPALALSGAVVLIFSIYFYQQSMDPDIIIVEQQARGVAGGPDTTGYTPPPDSVGTAPVKEAPPDPRCRPGKDCNTHAPYTPAPAPAPYAPPVVEEDCIKRSFVNQCDTSKQGCIKNVSFSQSYINMFLNAAYSPPYKLRGTDRQRLAIMGLLTAGYCPRRVNYSGAYRLPPETIIPRPHAGTNWRNYSLEDRTKSWKTNQRTNPLFCEKDKFDEIRKAICVVVYKNCSLHRHINRDCNGFLPNRNDDDDNDPSNNVSGGSTSGGTSGGTSGSTSGGTSGSNSGGKEVDNSQGQTNDNQGHGADRSGGQGDGPPGASQ